MEQITNLVAMIARALVDEPDQVKVNVIQGGSTWVFDKKDVGKIIGKQGRTADALRIIIAAVGAKLGNRCTLEIME